MTALLSNLELVSRLCLMIYALLALSSPSLVSASEIRPQTGEGVEQCVSSQLDWYMRAMGETPCKTYAALRQIANDRYTVPKFPLIAGPGDTCGGRDSRSCVNSVAFTLSMLCKSCQQCTENDVDCSNADPGSLEVYINNVVPLAQVDNGDISAQLTTHVCNRRMVLPNFLFSSISSQVPWKYQDVKALASVNNSRTILSEKCNAYFASVRAAASTTSVQTNVRIPSATAIDGPVTSVPDDQSASSTILDGLPAPTSAPVQGGDTSRGTSTVAIAIGSSVAAIIVLALVIGLLWMFIRRRRRQRYIDQHRVAISTYAQAYNSSASTSNSASYPEKRGFSF